MYSLTLILTENLKRRFLMKTQYKTTTVKEMR